MKFKFTLLALLFTTPAFAGTLADHAGTYRPAAENSSFCPADTTLTLSVNEEENAFRVEYVGPGTVNGVRIEGERNYELNKVSEVLVMPINHYQRIVLKKKEVVVQDKSKFSLLWTDESTLYSFARPDAITAYFTLVPCVFER